MAGGFQLTPADQAILSGGVSMTINPDPDPIDGFPSGNNIEFQFPPRLTADGKDAIWDEQNLFSWEPQAMWNGAAARRVTLEATYVVTSKSGSGKWTPSHVADVLRTYKAYFYRDEGALDPTNMPIIQLNIYEHAPKSGGQQPTWRAKSCSITTDGALINDGGSIHPLIAKVTMTLELLTKVQPDGDDNMFHNMDALPPKPVVEWY